MFLHHGQCGSGDRRSRAGEPWESSQVRCRSGSLAFVSALPCVHQWLVGCKQRCRCRCGAFAFVTAAPYGVFYCKVFLFFSHVVHILYNICLLFNNVVLLMILTFICASCMSVSLMCCFYLGGSNTSSKVSTAYQDCGIVQLIITELIQ